MSVKHDAASFVQKCNNAKLNQKPSIFILCPFLPF